MRRLILATLLVAIAVGLAYVAYMEATSTGTVTLTVNGYLAISQVDSTSSITLDPSTAPKLSYGGSAWWLAGNTADELSYNISGTNVNATIYLTLDSVQKPPSYTLTREPQLLATMLVSSSSSEVSAPSPTVYMNISLILPLSMFQSDTIQTNYTDLPEGFLNTMYGTTGDEASWKSYIVFAKIDVSNLPHATYDTSGWGKSNDVVCIVIVDPDLASTGAVTINGNEIILVKTGDCAFDSDGSNTTAAGTAGSRVDLDPNADWAYPFIYGSTTQAPANLAAYYDANATDTEIANTTLSTPDASTVRVYFVPRLESLSAGDRLVLYAAVPITYSQLASLYDQDLNPYAHIWPSVIVPFGAPAGSYTFQVTINLEQT